MPIDEFYLKYHKTGYRPTVAASPEEEDGGEYQFRDPVMRADERRISRIAAELQAKVDRQLAEDAAAPEAPPQRWNPRADPVRPPSAVAPAAPPPPPVRASTPTGTVDTSLPPPGPTGALGRLATGRPAPIEQAPARPHRMSAVGATSLPAPAPIGEPTPEGSAELVAIAERAGARARGPSTADIQANTHPDVLSATDMTRTPAGKTMYARKADGAYIDGTGRVVKPDDIWPGIKWQGEPFGMTRAEDNDPEKGTAQTPVGRQRAAYEFQNMADVNKILEGKIQRGEKLDVKDVVRDIRKHGIDYVVPLGISRLMQIVQINDFVKRQMLWNAHEANPGQVPRPESPKLTKTEELALENYQMEERIRQKNGETLPASITKGIAELLPYAGQMILTAGAAAPVRAAAKAATRGMEEAALKKMGVEAGERGLKAAAARGVVAAPRVIATEAAIGAGRAAAFPTVVAEKAIERTLPDFKPSDDDKKNIRMVLEQDGQPLGKAIWNSYLSQSLEFATEESGAYMQKLAPAARASMVKAMRALEKMPDQDKAKVATAAALKFFLRHNPNKKVPEFAKIAGAAGRQSYPAEVGEEQLNRILSELAGVDLTEEQKDDPAGERLRRMFWKDWQEFVTEQAVLAVFSGPMAISQAKKDVQSGKQIEATQEYRKNIPMEYRQMSRASRILNMTPDTMGFGKPVRYQDADGKDQVGYKPVTPTQTQRDRVTDMAEQLEKDPDLKGHAAWLKQKAAMQPQRAGEVGVGPEQIFDFAERRTQELLDKGDKGPLSKQEKFELEWLIRNQNDPFQTAQLYGVTPTTGSKVAMVKEAMDRGARANRLEPGQEATFTGPDGEVFTGKVNEDTGKSVMVTSKSGEVRLLDKAKWTAASPDLKVEERAPHEPPRVAGANALQQAAQRETDRQQRESLAPGPQNKSPVPVRSPAAPPAPTRDEATQRILETIRIHKEPELADLPKLAEVYDTDGKRRDKLLELAVRKGTPRDEAARVEAEAREETARLAREKTEREDRESEERADRERAAAAAAKKQAEEAAQRAKEQAAARASDLLRSKAAQSRGRVSAAWIKANLGANAPGDQDVEAILDEEEQAGTLGPRDDAGDREVIMPSAWDDEERSSFLGARKDKAGARVAGSHQAEVIETEDGDFAIADPSGARLAAVPDREMAKTIAGKVLSKAAASKPMAERVEALTDDEVAELSTGVGSKLASDEPLSEFETAVGERAGLVEKKPKRAPTETPPPPAATPPTTGSVTSSIDTAAAETDANPSEDQRKAGNYRKGRATIAGLTIAVENPAGARRKPEFDPLKDHYGHILRTEGRDGDPVDVFVKPGTPDDYDGPVYVVDQMKPGRTFDEHKVIIGSDSEDDAEQTYLRNYSPGWKGLGSIREMSMDEFKAWVKSDQPKKAKAAAPAPPKGESDPFKEAAVATLIDRLGGKTAVEASDEELQKAISETESSIESLKKALKTPDREGSRAIARSELRLEEEVLKLLKAAALKAAPPAPRPPTRRKDNDRVAANPIGEAVRELGGIRHYARDERMGAIPMREEVNSIPLRYRNARGSTLDIMLEHLKMPNPDGIIYMPADATESDLIEALTGKQRKGMSVDDYYAFSEEEQLRTTDLVYGGADPEGTQRVVLDVGDEFTIKGERFKVLEETDTALRIQDGTEYWIPYDDDAGLRIDKGSLVRANGEPSGGIGTLTKIDVVGLSGALLTRFDEITDNRTLKAVIMDLYGATAADLEFTKGYNHKHAQEAYEMALVRRARRIVVEAAGNRGQAFAELKKLYGKQANLGERTSKSLTAQAFSTPVPYAYLVGLYAGIDQADSVQDTTAGNGALEIARSENSTLVLNEADPVRAEGLFAQFPGLNEITNMLAEDITEGAMVDSVVENPPFGATDPVVFNGYKLTKREHIIVARSLSRLRDNGRAAFIIGGNLRSDQPVSGADRIFFNWLYHHYTVLHNFDVAGSVYAKQGTTYNTRLIVIAGRKAAPAGVAPFSEIKTRFKTTLEQVFNALREDEANGLLVRSEDNAKPDGIPGADRAGRPPKQAPRTGLRGPAGPQGPTADQPDADAGSGPRAGGDGGVEPDGPAGGGVRGPRLPAGGGGRGGDAAGGGAGAADEGVGPGGGDRPGVPGGGPGGAAPAGEDGRLPAGSGRGAAGGPERAGGPRGERDTPQPGGAGAGGADADAGLDGALDDILGGVDFAAGVNDPGAASGSAMGMALPPGTPVDPKLIMTSIKAGNALVQAGKTRFLEWAKILYEKAGEGILAYLPNAYFEVWKKQTAAMREKFDDPRLFRGFTVEQIKSALLNSAVDMQREIDRRRQEKAQQDAAKRQADEVERRKKKLAEEGGEAKVRYEAVSKGPSGKTLIPFNLYQHTRDSLLRVEREHGGDLDRWVADELGIKDVANLHRAFFAEQIDAIASAIHNNLTGGATIVGDQTGTGKGRIGAAMLLWYIKKGKTPIFVTAKADLFTDLYRDMIAVTDALGLPLPTPYIVNNDGVVMDPRTGGRTTLFKKTAQENEAFSKYKGNWSEAPFLKDRNLIVMTYSQIQNPDSVRKVEFLKAMMERGGIVLDESHSASGETSNTGNIFRSRIDAHNGEGRPPAEFVTYLSATFAKRPDNMSLYIRTVLGKQSLDYDELVSILTAGGVPMQEWIAEEIARAGQLQRRELDFSGVHFGLDNPYGHLSEERRAEEMKALEANMNTVGVALQRVWDFDDNLMGPVRQRLRDAILKAIGAGMSPQQKRSFSVDHTGFASLAHHITSQALLASRIDGVVQATLRHLRFYDPTSKRVARKDEAGAWRWLMARDSDGKMQHVVVDEKSNSILERSGRRITGGSTVTLGEKVDDTTKLSPSAKVVISTYNTMEAILQDLGFKKGDKLPEDRFLMAVGRTLNGIMKFTYRDNQNQDQTVTIDSTGTSLQADVPGVGVVDLGFPQLAKELADIRRMFDETEVPLPISPIDRIREELEKAGIKVAEATGRDFKAVDGVVTARTPEEQNTRGVIDGFNGGAFDVVIGNEAISTGISLHSSVDVADRRKRVMLAAQPHVDINKQVQMFGRVNRAGQINEPELYVMTSDLPVETRPTAILMRKMKLLNANTTAKGEGGYMLQVDDILNKYGDRIVWDYLNSLLQQQHPLAAMIRATANDKGILAWDVSDAAKKATGRITMVPVEMQREFYAVVLPLYKQKIDDLNAKGENDLVSTHLDLEAELVPGADVTRLHMGDDQANGLTSDTILQTYEVNNLNRPLSQSDVEAMAKKNERAAEKALQVVQRAAPDLMRRGATQEAPWSKKRGRPWFKHRADAGGTQHHSKWARIMEGLRYSTNTLRSLKMGRAYTFQHGDISDPHQDVGILVDVRTNADADNPARPSNILLTFAVHDHRKTVTLPLSQITRMSINDSNSLDYPQRKRHGETEEATSEQDSLRFTRDLLRNWDKSRGVERVQMQIITGNLVHAVRKLQEQVPPVRPSIITFTTKDGRMLRGIRLPAGKTIQAADTVTVSKAILLRLIDGGHVSNFFALPWGVQLQGPGSNAIIQIQDRAGAKKLVTNKDLTSLLVGDGMRKGTNNYVGMVKPENINALIDWLETQAGAFQVKQSDIPDEYRRNTPADSTMHGATVTVREAQPVREGEGTGGGAAMGYVPAQAATAAGAAVMDPPSTARPIIDNRQTTTTTRVGVRTVITTQPRPTNVGTTMDPRTMANPDHKFRLQMPELIHLMKMLNQEMPEIVQRIPRHPTWAGGFWSDSGAMKLVARLSGDPDLAAQVLAHEIGHMLDWLPHMVAGIPRGNILGRIASFLNFSGGFIDAVPTSIGPSTAGITQTDRNRLRNESEKEAKELFKLAGIDPTADQLKQIVERFFLDRLTAFAASKGVYTNTEITEELKALTIWWSPFDPATAPKKYVKYRFSSVELYAEAMSVLMNAPEELKRRAPRFHEAFFNWMEKKPEVKRVYDEIQNDLKSGAVYETRTDDVAEMFVAGRQQQAELELKALEGVTQRRGFNLKEMFISEADPLYKIIDAKGAADWRKQDNPLYEYYRMAYTNSIVHAYRLELQKKVQRPLMQADFGLKRKDGTNVHNEDVFGAFLFFRRIGDGEKWDRAHLFNPGGFQQETAIETKDQFEAAIGPANTALLYDLQQKLFSIRRDIVFPILEESGAYNNIVPGSSPGPGLPDRTLMDLIRDNDNYATWDVFKFMQVSLGTGAIGEGSAHIWRQIGTLSDIRNPYGATVLNDASLIHGAIRNTAKSNLVKWFVDNATKGEDWLEAEYEIKKMSDGTVRRIPKPPESAHKLYVGPFSGKWKLVTFNEDGQTKGYYLPRAVAELYERQPIKGALLWSSMSLLAQPFRELYTAKNPAFMVWNMQRDFWATLKQNPEFSKVGGPFQLVRYYVRTLRDNWLLNVRGEMTPLAAEMLKRQMLNAGGRGFAQEYGVKHILKKWKAGQEVGMRHDQLAEVERMMAKEQIDIERERGIGGPLATVSRKLWNIVTSPVRGLANVGAVIETAPKMATWLYLKEKTTLSEAERINRILSRAGSPNFRDGGSMRHIYNTVFLFSNPQIVGWRAAATSAKEDKWDYFIKTFLYNIVPKLLMIAAYNGWMDDILAWLRGGAVSDYAEREGKRMGAIQEAYSGFSDYTLSRRIVIALGMDKNGQSYGLQFPLDFVGETITTGLWELGKTVKNQRAGNLVAFGVGQVPFSEMSLHPAFKLAAAWLTYTAGKNHWDSFRSRWVIPENVAKQYFGFSFRWPPFHNSLANDYMGAYSFNALASSSIYSMPLPDRIAPDPETPVEHVMKAPVVGNVLRRFYVKESRGVLDRLYNNPALLRENDDKFQRANERVEFLRDHIRDNVTRRTTPQQLEAKIQEAWNESQRRGWTEDYSFQQYRTMYRKTTIKAFGGLAEQMGIRFTKDEQRTLTEQGE